MKWAIRSVGKTGGRLGSWADLSPKQEVYETPTLVMYTKGGSVPHLSYDVLGMTSLDLQTMQVPLVTTLESRTAVGKFNRGIAGFAGMEEQPVYCTVQDPATQTPRGYNDSSGISLWTRLGRRQLDVEKYMGVVETFRPRLYQALCDGDTDLSSSKKRVRKAVDRTLEYLSACVEKHESSEVLCKSAILGVIEGGYCTPERERSAKQTATFPVAGFVLDGFHTNGSDAEKITSDDLRDIVSETLKHLPDEKPRFIHGAFNPSVVLLLVELGIDVFDTSFPFLETERGEALTFGFQLEKTTAVPVPAETGRGDAVVSEGNDGSVTDCESWGISMKDEKFSDDFSPIKKDCACYTCRKFTRAYIHHLLNVQEMLAPVLLMIHNLRHYQQFFQAIRNAVKDDRLEDLKQVVCKHECQLLAHQWKALELQMCSMEKLQQHMKHK